ncbi:MAG: (d)CMP kinase, partial [Candidatus Rokuibacteriota bacterium]
MRRGYPVVTIDGPAAGGKSTVARRLATRLGYGYLPSGAIYRAVAWQVQVGIPLARALEGMRVEFRGAAESLRIFVNDDDATNALYTPEVTGLAAAISQHPEVRAFADEIQRRVAAAGPVVVEGRDAGTVVFPDADCKFYLDASLEARAQRRAADYRERGEPVAQEAIREALAARDRTDQTRA